MYVNQSLLSLFVAEPGLRTVRLPRSATVEDLFTGETVAQTATEFVVNMPSDTTRIWRLR
ncbi:MAG: hypothetical protein ACUVX8_11885 [Candidatus Zipacnadales bacterium]